MKESTLDSLQHVFLAVGRKKLSFVGCRCLRFMGQHIEPHSTLLTGHYGHHWFCKDGRINSPAPRLSCWDYNSIFSVKKVKEIGRLSQEVLSRERKGYVFLVLSVNVY